MFYLDEMQDTQKGEKLILICGGTDSVKNLFSIPNLDQYQFAGCNQHAIIIPYLSWVFAHDDRMVDFIKDQGVTYPIITHKMDQLREHDILATSCPYVKLTAPEALWTAGFLGYEEIHILGADDYGHPFRDYWHQFITKDEPTDTKREHKHTSTKAWKTILSEWTFTKNVFFYSGLKDLKELIP